MIAIVHIVQQLNQPTSPYCCKFAHESEGVVTPYCCSYMYQ